ncbi:MULTISPECIES: hemerythrin domain-containing protein [unclassified Streptomyces]|uniref:hemerythrin domain-containing protein n=1 Tax=unclassified Streptomyces TaxID=2593676 RepID=UPI000376DDAA|nr:MULTISPECIES: hemerythrin domain-containing protein [unclassified Streptomyces]MYT33712.1 hypothetical protein [Streptomyces sp. SID8354]
MSHTMHQSDLTWELKRDHRTIQALLDRICSAGASLDQEQCVRHAADELERHAVAERRFLLPVVRCEMRDGDVLAGRLEAEYPDVLGALDGAAASAALRDTAVEGRIQGLTAAFDRHVRLCEREVFPRVCRICSEAELARLGAEFHRHAHRHHADIA